MMHNQAATQEHVSQSFQCSHCTLEFKTNIFLFEHLTNVHGSHLEDAVSGAGLTNNAKSDDSESSSEESQLGDFETGRLEVFNEEELNHQENSNNFKEEVFKIQAFVSDEEEYPPTSKSKDSSKDLRSYKKTLQTSISNYFVVGPQSTSENSSDSSERNDNKGSNSSDRNKSSNIIDSSEKVDTPAKSLDIDNKSMFLQYNHLFQADLTPPIHQGKEPTHKKKINKKTNEAEDKTLVVPENKTNEEPSGRKEYSFEVSEDDEEKKVSDATVSPQSYLCKHCSHKDGSLIRMSAHYHKAHPYIRYHSNYVQDPGDCSATFRCLACPIEFSSEVDLKKHYSDEHTGAPDIFLLQRHQLGLIFKCFQCTFTSDAVDTLKEHYKENHRLKTLNPLMFLKYMPTQCQEGPSQLKCEKTPSLAKPQKTSPKVEPNVASYRCNCCQFSHTSVIVMHVHYQKNHPEEEVTFDKIKQLACVMSPAAKKTPMDQNSSRKTEKVKRKSSQSLLTHPEAPTTKKTESSKDRDEGNNLTPELGTQPTEHAQKTVEGTLKQNTNAKLQKLLVKAPARTTSKPSKETKSSKKELKQKESDNPATSLPKINLYAKAQDLFYCRKCNYGNPAVKGIKAHQVQMHQSIHSSNERIVGYTSEIHDQLEKLKAQAKDESFSPSLPLPILKKGEENMFFCHFCNFRRQSMCELVHHYFVRHPGFEATTEEIKLYTSKILQQLQITPEKTTAVGEMGEESVEEPQNKKIKTASQKLKTIQCHNCAYKTYSASLFRIHTRKCHRVNNSSSGVLKVYLKQENVQSGYQCDLCSFSHKKSAMLCSHYRQEHPDKSLSLDFITTGLQDDHKTSSVKKKSRIKRELDSANETDGPLQTDTKTFSCRACSFKGSNVASIKDHYRAVHPWCVKDDGSVPNVSGKKKSNDQKEYLDSFDDYQIPLEFEKSPRSSPEHDLSPPSELTNNTPRGTKKKKSATKSIAKQQDEIQGRVQVFKCTYCTYVNTKHQGVLTHCQMRHTDLKSRAESLHVDEKQVRDWNDGMKTKGHWDMFKTFRGYMCKLCPKIFATSGNLKKHCETAHNGEPAPDIELDVGKTKQKKIQKNPVPSYKSKITIFRCQQCPYTSSTKIAFGRHLRFKHKNANIQDFRYNCVLCSNSYFKKKRLGVHYTTKHGKDAFQKYFIPLHDHVLEPPLQTSASSPERPDPESPPSPDSKITKQVFRCPCCPYVNSRYHGMSIHCQMLHTDFAFRINEFVKDEIVINSSYQSGSSNKRGYLCNLCPGIFVTQKKLGIHSVKKHSPDALPTTSPNAAAAITKNEKPSSGDQDFPSSLLKALAQSEGDAHSEFTRKKSMDHHTKYKCSLCPYSSQIRKRLAGHYSKEHGKAAFLKHFAKLYLYKKNKKPQPAAQADVKTEEPVDEVEQQSSEVEPEATIYKCRFCVYETGARRYLIYHYKNTHQLDADTRNEMLQEYNKRKKSLPSQQSKDLEETFERKCKKCPDLVFDSPQLLIAHYSSVHHTAKSFDFTIIYPLGRSTGVYKCIRCLKQLNGIKNLCQHLDLHRQKMWMNASKTMALASPAKPDGPRVHDMPEGAHEGNSLREEDSLPSPSKPTEEEQQDPESESKNHGCTQCQRKFKSLIGLRTHERSHATRAALQELPSSQSQLGLNKYLINKPGTIKPFQCSICFYRTNLIGLWNSHLLKNHIDVIIETTDTDNQEESPSTEKDRLPSCDQFPPKNEGRTKDWYLEPPEVQRQLSHFSLMAQNGASTEANMQTTRLSDSGPFHCEYCGFISEGLASLRRHYMSRHGRKLFRCTDCDFFTGLRKTLKMHMEMDHSTVQKEPPSHDSVRCPFCLYQTKSKNNMIDHVLLHREERVVPMEVRRPRLSRYLHGVVFRCHKCTYTSATGENLRSHVAKHDNVKPYRCRLCYFDCSKLSNLEAHLCSKHQVVRNHELVGQVNLDQLEMKGNEEEEEEEEEERSSVENEDVFTDSNQATEERDSSEPAEDVVRMEKSICKDKKMQEEESGSSRTNPEEPENNSDLQSGHGSFIQEEGKEDAEGSSKESHESGKLSLKSLQDKTLNAEARVEKDILRHILQRDEDGKLHARQEESTSVRRVIFQDVKREVDGGCSPLRENVSLKSTRDDKRKLGDSYGRTATANEGCLQGERSPVAPKEGQDEEDKKTRRGKLEELQEKERGGKTLGPKSKDREVFGGASEMGDAAAPEEKTFPCELCGRNLRSKSELEIHAARHGM
ncbi:zinc finger protein 462-like isoform X2 [Entelurus aequoreus]|uniref:zinc finger protein 462-like isoform X2 n=1 Tax=Entelurus aequoreus TaxID=161455 RepID=UPI002B1E814B|nr:zinc finger protein 462-like isoform X2 [Entelurus aequoreus]